MDREIRRADVGILGAGIMGSCLALEVARRGHRVDLIDLAPIPMTGASLHNEGKLHLGFVYAKDPSRQTHDRLLRGSLAFQDLIQRWCGCPADSLLPSRPFHYFVPVDSQLDMVSIENHFAEVEGAIHEATRGSGSLYLGRRADRYYVRNTPGDHGRLFSPHSTLGSFRTEERSVSTPAVADVLRRALERQSNVRFLGNTEVRAAHRLPGGEVEIETRLTGGHSSRRYRCVANCLWDDRLRVDQTAGIPDDGPWMSRYKAMVRIPGPAPGPDEIPSATGLLGPYGDVVHHHDGSYYISWYPLCRLSHSLNAEARGLHEMVHRGYFTRRITSMASRCPSLSRVLASLSHQTFVRDNIRRLADYVPPVAGLLGATRRSEVGGGVIVARGATDIDDPMSLLHQRAAIGPVRHGSYVTVDTGKYCMAPMLALEAADMFTEVL